MQVKEFFDMGIREQLVAARAKCNLTQEELAKELGVSFSTVNRWECGRSKPTRKALFIFKEFCKKRGVELEDVE